MRNPNVGSLYGPPSVQNIVRFDKSPSLARCSFGAVFSFHVQPPPMLLVAVPVRLP